jgi:DinB superfamily
MRFDLSESVAVLERTPRVLSDLLAGLPAGWVTATEGPETWSPFDVVGHLIHGERTDWIPRLEIILADGEGRAFEPFDRFAQFAESRGRTIEELLDTFAVLRAGNLARLASFDISPADLGRRGRHPELGTVTLEQLLATWVAHDLSHLGQIARVMGKAYTEAVGPWAEYLPMLRPRELAP